MKKAFLAVAVSIVLCAAGFTGYKVYDNYRMSKLGPLMLENLQLLTEDESWFEKTDFFATLDDDKVYENDFDLHLDLGIIISKLPLDIGLNIGSQSGFIGIYRSCKFHLFDTCDTTKEGWVPNLP